MQNCQILAIASASLGALANDRSVFRWSRARHVHPTLFQNLILLQDYSCSRVARDFG